MALAISVVTPPAEEPVTAAEAKRQCYVDHTDEDTLFTRWIRAAREMAEDITNRKFVTQTVRLELDRFPPFERSGWEPGAVGFENYASPGTFSWSPHTKAIRLPGGAVQSVTSVKYYDTVGTQATLTASTAYLTHLRHMPPLVYPAPGTFWPVTQFGRLAAVEVVYVAGYGTVASGLIPQQVGQAILLAIKWWHQRGDCEDAKSVGLPQSAKDLLDRLRVGEQAT